MDDTPKTGLTFGIARQLTDVVAAWRLVYRSYRRTGLIPRNRWRLHTVPQAVVEQRSVVVCGRSGSRTVSTLSAYLDGPMGLPLDSVYPRELDALRAEDRRLVEFGLFADRRRDIGRSLDAILELMRHVCYFGVTSGATDGIIGVHPRHAPFYQRLLAFDPIGDVRYHPTVNGAAVTLLRMDWAAKASQPKLPRGLRYWIEHPLHADVFAERPTFHPSEVAAVPALAGYVEHALAPSLTGHYSAHPPKEAEPRARKRPARLFLNTISF